MAASRLTSDGEGDNGAAAFAPGDTEVAADDACTEMHRLQSDACLPGLGFLSRDGKSLFDSLGKAAGNTNAIIGDCQKECSAAHGEADFDFPGLAVTDGIAYGFLGDSVQMGGGGVVSDLGHLVPVKSTVNVKQLGHLHGQRVQSAPEAGFEVNGIESTGEITGLPGAIANGFGKSSKGIFCGIRTFGQSSGSCIDAKGDADQILAKSVVKVLSDSTLFVGSGFEDLAFELPSSGQVVKNGREEPAAIQINFADGQINWKSGAVFSQAGDFSANADDFATSGTKIIGEISIVLGAIRLWHELIDICSKEFGTTVSKESLGSRIDRFDSSVSYKGKDGFDG